ncbi:MAG TPA: tetraacyldisaccharide 4'-kinase [Chitinophagales bacterium]|nr:tetraacyldisaccharide 4'-kinase [Chitinophagales bacterium]
MRKLLLPFSWLYGAGVFLHNKLFDLQIKKSVEFELPVISVGNLSTGGTGKTPHVEYIVKLLSEKYHVGVLSRGYRRKTSGYFLVEENSAAEETGDEPLQIKRKFPQATVAVCEERAIGIPIMLLDDPQLEVIVLDDAFQHRRVKPGLSILLTDYAKPFTKDFLLPSGNLREPKQNASRADVIVVTKCPGEVSSEEKALMSNEMTQRNDQEVFFSFLKYADAYNLFEPEKKTPLDKIDSALIITGIASPDSLLSYLRSKIKNVHHLKFSDHHSFTQHDLKIIAEGFQKISRASVVGGQTPTTAILTTEKDGVRLLPFRNFLVSQQLEITCIPVEVQFSATEKEKFDSLVGDFANKKLAERIS